MRDRYSLRVLGDAQLLSALSRLVQVGHRLNADVLAHLAEVDERRLHLELGFPSLFAYCTESLGLSESAAGRRITAARVCRKFAGTFARVAGGELHLSALCALSPHLNPENAGELFDSCSRKTRRRVEELLAARFPKSDVRDSVRRLPVEALSPERFGFHCTGNSTLKKKLELARALTSHELPNGDMAALFELALDALIRDREKARFSLGRKPRRTQKLEPATKALPPGERTDSEPAKRSRHVPAQVAREVYVRDHGECGFTSKDGQRCGSRVFLEFDHSMPFGAGGKESEDNLRLRCRAHNQWHARRYFGGKHIDRAIARSRQRRKLASPEKPRRLTRDCALRARDVSIARTKSAGSPSFLPGNDDNADGRVAQVSCTGQLLDLVKDREFEPGAYSPTLQREGVVFERQRCWAELLVVLAHHAADTSTGV